MKIASLTIVHYGCDFLRWSIRSVASQVDEIVVLYSDKPSHGQSTSLICHDTEAALRAEAEAGAGDAPLKWISSRWASEGAHRDALWEHTDAELIVIVDADEFWPEDYLAHAIAYAKNSGARNFLVRMIHFWRSFGWVCRDAMMPVRIMRRSGSGDDFVPNPEGDWSPIYHFGYARKPGDILYKLSIHGHRAEWKKGWFEGTFMKWPPGNDLHPTCDSTWGAEPFDREKFPAELRDHPYFDMEPIE